MNQPSQSRRPWAWGGLAGTLVLTSIGCTPNALMVRQDHHSADAVVRAQTPDPLAQNPDLAGHLPPPEARYVSHEGIPIPAHEAHMAGAMDGPYNYCPPQEGAHGGMYCPPGYDAGHGFGGRGLFRPSGLTGHSYTYQDPGMPVYPPGTGPALTGPGSPGAIIQYPYYTTKGPDDFFHDEDGRY